MGFAGELKVPYGINSEGERVWAKAALRAETYYCPDCGGELVLRRGKVMRPHFAHRAIPEDCDFIHESEAHFAAKHRVKELVEAGKQIAFVRKCSTCETEIAQRVPKDVVKAEVEHTLGTGHRADVGLFDTKGRLRAVIEVFATHRVDDEKSEALNEAGISWSEIEAKEILESSSWSLMSDYFAEAECRRCQLRRKNEERIKVLPWQFRSRLRFGTIQKRPMVKCPLKDGKEVDVFERCGCCQYHIDAREEGVHCCAKDR